MNVTNNTQVQATELAETLTLLFNAIQADRFGDDVKIGTREIVRTFGEGIRSGLRLFIAAAANAADNAETMDEIGFDNEDAAQMRRFNLASSNYDLMFARVNTLRTSIVYRLTGVSL